MDNSPASSLQTGQRAGLAPPPTTVPVLDERISDANDSTGNQFEGASPTIANASQTRNAALNGGPMRANSRFGHNLRRDPVAGEVYSHLSVAVEVIACLLATASGSTRRTVNGGALVDGTARPSKTGNAPA